jgi:predicted hotdog family 3-hydroxylacyl-ACP dehydratase
MNVTTLIAVPSGGAYFEGHFPGRPILPGVAEIALTLEALARETRADMALRGIAYTRLRQVVVPGDRLELAARTGDGGRLRVDLKRAGVLVANGEFLLGAPETADDAAPVGLDEAVPLSGLPPLDALLPHRPPMRFIESILAETADSLTCAASIPSVCALVSGGSVPAVVGLEAAAQAAAAWEALQRRRAGGVAAPRVGYLVALRDVVFFAARIPADRSLRVTVTLEAAAPPLSHYRAALSLNGRPLVRGMIATFLKEDGAHRDPAGR